MTDRAERTELVDANAEVESASTVATDQRDLTSSENAKDIEQSLLDQQLIRTARWGNSDQVNDLMKRGANVNYIDEADGRTPLHQPCSGGRGPVARDVISLVIEHGAEVDRRDFMGVTPLLLACLTSEVFAIPPLLEAGANVHVAHNDGSTPLHIASQNGMAMIIEMLVRSNASTETKNNAGRTALHEAALAKAETAEYAAEALLQGGAFVDMPDHWGNTALHLCPLRGATGVMNALLRHGRVQSINTKNNYGATPLHEACRVGFREGVKLLLRNGADTALTDDNGETARYVAKEAGFEEIASLIDEYLAPNDIQAERGRPYSLPSVLTRSSSGPRSDRVGTPIRRPKEHSSEEEPLENEESNAQIETQDTIAVHSPDIPNNVWTGVRRENGDGFILANYDHHDISFDAKLESILPCIHEGKDMHEIQFLVNFMRPYSMDHRIRYANIDVLLTAKEQDNIPNIRGIMPQADRVEVSDMEISSGQKLTVGAAGSGGPSNVNISMEGSKSKTSSFKGVRIIHGAIKDRMHACWRLYEEPGSKSGLPEIVRLLMLVHCDAEFELRLDFSVKARHSLSFGLARTLTAPTRPSYLVPRLRAILALEQESRLKQMLDVADRAATVVEEAKAFETRFSCAMRQHAKKDLIMQAGMKESYRQEWTDILDASKLFDFRSLREKLLEMEPPRRVRERMRLDPTDRTWLPPAEDMPYENIGIRRPRRRRSYDSEDRVDIVTGRRGKFGDVDRRRADYGYESRSRNAMQGFSAVGPGYHVSRMA